jgi:KRAB domain-containing zinc finger protein
VNNADPLADDKQSPRTNTAQGRKQLDCQYCHEAFLSQESLGTHEQTHQWSHTGEKPHKSTECAKAFAQPSDLKRHVQMHKNEKPYKCTKCPFSAARLVNLNLHMQTIHPNEKPYECKEFSEIFALADTYE